ncbi:MoaD/ThiS family protein [Conexibacter arvalis]|uniref:Molybdopterin converting factor small subunit n=1 Tax=Conexibacter arvalis TaxID=912552 RepID=A0A840IH42_9ACTN|nr:MoaD/ThiS family protein [Conexibacter arvalis]MBB4663503.1 molybdopterin converting factor small subunit [Conexibacter arvalis]
MRVKVRLGAGLARLAAAPLLTLDLPDGATVAELRSRLGAEQPELAPALASALPVRAGSHVTAADALADGDEVALLLPVSGG